jgi:hypothetical protein
MSWLYGEDWASTTSTDEYTFAQDRIRKRRIGRWMFLVHLLIFVPVNSYILILAVGVLQFDNPSGIWMLSIPLIWLFFLLAQAWYAFPTAGRLARHEQKLGAAIEREIAALHLDKQKRGEKAKRQDRLVLSDDGELLEVPETTDSTDAKSKREIS